MNARTTFICSNAAGLYVCNTAGQIEGIARIPNAFAGSYFGISWLRGGAELVLGHDPGQPDVEYGDETAILTRQNSRLSIGQRYVEIALSSPHQITATPDGRILIANTARNALTVLRSDGTFHHIWFDGYEWDRYSTEGEEGSHFNSVLWHDGLVYMLAHNHQRGSYALVLDGKTFEIKRRINSEFRGCHNLWVTDDEIYTLSSFTGELRSMITQEVVWSSGDATSLLRGLAVGKTHILVGDSDRVARSDRNFAGGGVYVIDRSTMKTVDYVDFGYNGGTCEVRILDDHDECHNVGSFCGEIQIDEAFTRSVMLTRQELKMARARSTLDPDIWSMQEGALNIDGDDITVDPDYFGLATLKGTNCDDTEITAEICFEPTPKIQQVGIVVRHNGPRDRNLYLAFFEYYDRYTMFKWLVNDSAGWHTLYAEHLGSQLRLEVRYESRGTRHVVAVDGLVRLDKDDLNFLTGSAGLRMRGGRVRHLAFDSKEISGHQIRERSSGDR
jgi:hypothetical protein